MFKRTARYRGSITADLRDSSLLRPAVAKRAHSCNTPCRNIVWRSREAVTAMGYQLLPALVKPLFCNRIASHSFTKPGLIYVWN